MNAEILYEINEKATSFYQEELDKSKEGQAYLEKRKINVEPINKFKIGYASFNNELYDYLKEQGYNDEDILETKLCIKTEGGISDYFKNRMIFPIFDENNIIVAFSGRKIDETEGVKYLNTIDNQIYMKRKNLYGINFAKNYSNNGLILVEGFIDVISLNKVEIKNVVALMGTAIAEEQIELIKKYTNKVIFCFDVDCAGQNASLYAGELLEEYYGIKVSVLQYDVLEIKDPDEYVNEYGAERFKSLVKNAIPLIEYKVKMLEKEHNLNNASDKIAFLKCVSEIISNLKSEIKKEVYIDEFSSKYGISKEALKEDINLFNRKN